MIYQVCVEDVWVIMRNTQWYLWLFELFKGSSISIRFNTVDHVKFVLECLILSRFVNGHTNRNLSSNISPFTCLKWFEKISIKKTMVSYESLFPAYHMVSAEVSKVMTWSDTDKLHDFYAWSKEASFINYCTSIVTQAYQPWVPLKKLRVIVKILRCYWSSFHWQTLG